MSDEKKRGNRWYDQHPELADKFDQLRTADKPKQESVVRKMMRLLLEQAPEAVEQAANQRRPDHMRRWYDASPQLWTAVNAFQFADSTSIAHGVSLMGDELFEGDKKDPDEAESSEPAVPKPQA